MAAAKKATKRKAPPTTASAATAGPEAALKIPITHHAVTSHISRAEAALDLFRLAEEHYEDGDDALEFARGICLDVIGDELTLAKGAYFEAVGDKTASATETAR